MPNAQLKSAAHPGAAIIERSYQRGEVLAILMVQDYSPVREGATPYRVALFAPGQPKPQDTGWEPDKTDWQMTTDEALGVMTEWHKQLIGDGWLCVGGTTAPTPKKIGEMTPEERRGVLRAAVASIAPGVARAIRTVMTAPADLPPAETGIRTAADDRDLVQVVRAVISALQVPRNRFGKLDNCGLDQSRDMDRIAKTLGLPHGGLDIVDKAVMVLQAAIGDKPTSIMDS